MKNVQFEPSTSHDQISCDAHSLNGTNLLLCVDASDRLLHPGIYHLPLYYLAANTQYAVTLCDEVNVVVAEYGWTKAAVDQMYRNDGFI